MKVARVRLVVALVALAWLAPSTATARLNKKQTEELEGYLKSVAEVKDMEARQASTLALGHLGSKDAKQQLAALKTGDDGRLRLSALLALAMSGDKKAPAAVASEIQTQGSPYGLLRNSVAVAPDKVELKIIEAYLKVAKPDEKGQVFRYLAEQNGALLDFALTAVASKDAEVRGLAASALVAGRRAEALGPAAKLLKNKDEKLRREAVDLIVAFSRQNAGDEKATALLEQALADKSPSIRELAARRLVELKHKGAADELIERAKALPTPADQAKVLSVVVASGIRPTFGKVEPLLAAEDRVVKEAAFALAASSRDGKFIDKLVEMHGSTEFEDRLLAIKVIGRSQDPRALVALRKSLTEGRADIRAAAAKGFVDLGDEKGLDALELAMRHEQDANIRLTLLDAIGATKAARAVQILRFQVTSQNPDVKKHTLTALETIGRAEGAKALDVLLRDRNLEVQWQAFLTALSLDPKTARSSLTSALRNPPAGFLNDIDGLDPQSRKLVYEYLLEKGSGTLRHDAARRAILETTFDDILYKLAVDETVDAALRRDLVFHFGSRASKKDMMVLERLVRSKTATISRLAAWMLVRHPDPAYEATLRGAVSSKDDTLKSVAVLGLASIWNR